VYLECLALFIFWGDFKAYCPFSENQTVLDVFLVDFYNHPELKKGFRMFRNRLCDNLQWGVFGAPGGFFYSS
jgi:hypothetical protein